MPNTSLDIRLAEPVVFLRGSGDAAARRRHAAPPETAPAMVRGILTLKLAKATKIRSVSITLEGKAKTEWPEGIGARRAEVTEDVNVLSASTVFFRAGHEHDVGSTTAANAARRTMSVGPGVALDHEADDERGLSDDEPNHEHRHEHAVRERQRRLSADLHHFQRHFVEHNEHIAAPTPPYTPRTDQGFFELNRHGHESRGTPSAVQTPASSRPSSMHGPIASHSSVPRMDAHHRVISAPPSQVPSTAVSSDTSVRSLQPDISEHPSDEENDHLEALQRPPSTRRESSFSFMEITSTSNPRNDSSNSTERQRSVSASTVSHSPSVRPEGLVNRASASPAPPRPILQTSASYLRAHGPSPNSSTVHPSFSDSPASSSPVRERDCSESRTRGRPASRFSLSAVSNVLHEIGHEITEITDRVRSKSRASVGPTALSSTGRNRIPSRSAAKERDWVGERVRERNGGDGEGAKDEGPRGRRKEREKTALEKIGASLGLNHEGSGGDVDGEEHMWQEFRKGTYNYPISFAIPSNTPPTLRCDFGSIVYRLKAVVHRTGTFVPKLVAQSEVTLISSLSEDDTEETENIAVERQWDEDLRYFITVSGKCFSIGSVIPITLVMMPLAKVRVYRINVLLEEKIDYYAHGRRVARHDPVRRYELLSLKHPGGSPKHHHEKGNKPPLLPILDDEDMQNSPLWGLVEDRPEEQEGEGAINLWNPNGPWTLHLQAHLPTCSSPVHFTCKHTNSNITISHWIKIIIRVDRGEEEKEAEKKRKQFDIIVETPVHLLSCKCNPEYTALPPYTSSSPSQAQQTNIGPVPGQCLCDHSRNRPHPPAPSASTLPLPGHGLGHGVFNVPVADLGVGPRRTSGGVNMNAPDGLMSAYGTDLSSPSRLGRSGVAINHWKPVERRPSEPGERLTALVDRSLQFARLVSGEEDVSGDTPPAYAEAVHGEERGRGRRRIDAEERGHVMFSAEAISGDRNQSRAQSRSQPGSRPGSRPPSVMLP